MLVLAFDTATQNASFALARPGCLIEETVLTEKGGHARDLVVRLDDSLRARGLGPRDLTGVAVTIGPGSFTGLRVGMATAKGMAYALNVPLLGLSTLEALARASGRITGARPPGVCAVLDAGRGEVYAARFRFDDSRPVRLDEERSWKPDDLLRGLPPDVPLIGDGARLLRAAVDPATPFPPVLHDHPPLAGAIALWAAGAISPGTVFQPATLKPNYIRPTDAEAARRRARGG